MGRHYAENNANDEGYDDFIKACQWISLSFRNSWVRADVSCKTKPWDGSIYRENVPNFVKATTE